MPHFQFNAPDVRQEKETVSIPKASSSQDGLMSKEDKAKLDGVASQANKFTLAAATASALGGVKQGVKVDDATGQEDAHTKLNALLASLRTAGVIATK